MGAPLRKTRVVANDFYRPAPALAPAPSPRVIPFVRLAPAPPPRRNFFWAVALAAIFMGATIFLLGAVAGTVFWFTYDARVADVVPVTPTPMKIAETPPQILPAPPQVTPMPPVSTPAPADIVLPAESLTPPPAPQAAIDAAAVAISKPNGLQMTMRDAAPEEADDPEADAGAQAMAAKILARRGDFAAAIAHLTRAARAEPDNLAYRFDLAVLYDRDGQAAAALMLYRQVLEAVEDVASARGDAPDEATAEAPYGAAAPLPPKTLAAIRARAGYLEGLVGE